MSTTTLAIIASPRVSRAVNPPPRKAEIIEAMALRKHQALTAEAQKNAIEIRDLKAKLDQKACEIVRAAGKIEEGYVDYRRCYSGVNEGDITEVSVRVVANQIPADIQKLNRKLREAEKKLQPRSVPSLHLVRQQIRAAMANHTPRHERVSKLLSDPGAARAIDRAIEELERPKVNSAPAESPSV